jgi:hypothetical protein
MGSSSSKSVHVPVLVPVLTETRPAFSYLKELIRLIYMGVNLVFICDHLDRIPKDVDFSKDKCLDHFNENVFYELSKIDADSWTIVLINQEDAMSYPRKIIEKILSHGWEINHLNEDNMRPLDYALKVKELPSIELYGFQTMGNPSIDIWIEVLREFGAIESTHSLTKSASKV